MPYYERPTTFEQDLWEIAGYVSRLWVDQEGDRDEIKFTLKVYFAEEFWAESGIYTVYLDSGTTVALAQLQLLRDAMANRRLVHVHFSYDWSDSVEVYYCYVYWLRIYDLPFPTTIYEWREQKSGEYWLFDDDPIQPGG